MRELFPLEDLKAALAPRQCTGCHAPDGFIYTYDDSDGSHAYCARCSEHMTLYRAAESQLVRLLLPVVAAWARHWDPILERLSEPGETRGILGDVGPHLAEYMAPALEGLSAPETPSEHPRDGDVSGLLEPTEKPAEVNS